MTLHPLDTSPSQRLNVRHNVSATGTRAVPSGVSRPRGAVVAEFAR